MDWKRVTTLIMVGVAGLATGCSAASTNGWPPKAAESSKFSLQSEAFGDKQPIPQRYATDSAGGENISPPLSWEDPPLDARSFAIEVVDLHPAAAGWVHWKVIDIPADESSLPEGASGSAMPGTAKELSNGFGGRGWGGPQPPKGSGRHDYRFTVIALDTPSLGIDETASEEEFRTAVKEHALDSAALIGTYQR